MTDLDKLIEAVEGGTLHEMPYGGMPMATKVYHLKDSSILAAYHGSLDAWLALHDALLPDMLWSISPLGKVQVLDKSFNVISESGYTNSVACSGLLATLKAYRAQVQL